jgi:hypothetical protein
MFVFLYSLSNNMMNFISLITAFGLLFSPGPKKVEIPLPKYSAPMEMVDLGENGFIFKTSKQVPYTMNLDWTLRYYNTDLTLRWETAVNSHSKFRSGWMQFNSFPQQMAATRDGSYVYHIEITSDGMLKKSEFYLTQITGNGKAKEHLVDEKIVNKIFGDRIAVACSEEHMIYLTLEGSKPGKPHILTFNRWSHASLEYSKIEKELAFEDKQSTGWQYLTHSPDKVWMMQKTISKDDDSYVAKLIALDWEGNQIQEILLRDVLSDRMIEGTKYGYVPYTNQDQTTRFQIERSYNHRPETSTSNAASSSSPVLVAAEGSEIGITIDEEKNTIYTYAFTAQKRFNGYFITTFDMEGKKKWTYKSKSNDPVLSNKKLIKHTAARSTYLVPMKSGFRLHHGGYDEINTYYFTDEGKMTSSFSNEFWMFHFDDFNECLPDKMPERQYMIKNPPHKIKLYYKVTMDEEHPVVIHYEKRRLTLLKW